MFRGEFLGQRGAHGLDLVVGVCRERRRHAVTQLGELRGMLGSQFLAQQQLGSGEILLKLRRQFLKRRLLYSICVRNTGWDTA